MNFKKALFIFHRDLRLEDNTTLIAALENSQSVIPSFIFTNTQLKNNEYRAENSVQFMINSLKELHSELRTHNSQLYAFEGEQVSIIEKLIKEEQIDAVFENKDYTPFAKQREEDTKKLCEKHTISYISLHDALLNPPKKVTKDDGNPYTVFTPYLRKATQSEIKKPKENKHINYYTQTIKDTILVTDIQFEENKKALLKGGRKEALKMLKEARNIKHYKQDRDYPKLKETTQLSAHNKFGTISIREAYYNFKDVEIQRQLYWRDFFYQIASNFPKVFGNAFHDKYNDVEWENNDQLFKAWCEGKTGFPIVDAGMRELNETGYMHNRTRMIVASFLTKDLLIDWRKGEKYFATKLLDYDPAVNNGSWQWAASTGCDAQPYFRIFNPWSQQKRFDADCEYIKKWVPELKDLSAKEIHNLEHTRPIDQIDYPKPIITHKEQREKALAMYKKI